jgi:hypothetical protein
MMNRIKTKIKNVKSGRREFLIKALSSCAICCLSTIDVNGSERGNPFEENEEHKFLADSGMSLQEVYNFAYKLWYIPTIQNLKDQIGQDRFIEMLKISVDKIYNPKKDKNKDYSQNTLSFFAERTENACKKWNDRLSFEVLRKDENLFEIKFTECLWAKTFREANAADIGYAGICYGDYSMTKFFNPKLKLDRNKTLMQGHDCCHFKWSMED